MNELINIENQEAVLKVIGKALREEKYEIAADILIALNEVRSKNGLKPYSVNDVLFIRYMDLAVSDIEEKPKCLYVAEYSDNSVKIGVSINPVLRTDVLSFQKGRDLKRVFYSKPIKNAFEIEKNLHAEYSEDRIKGEYFDIDFEKVLKTVKNKYHLGVSISKNIYKKHAVIEG